MKASSNKCDAEIKKVLKKKQGNINFCYDRAVKDDDSLAGNIKLRITIKSGTNKVSFARNGIPVINQTSPANDSYIPDKGSSIFWIQATDSDSDDLFYKLYFGTNSNNLDYVANSTTNSIVYGDKIQPDQ